MQLAQKTYRCRRRRRWFGRPSAGRRRAQPRNTGEHYVQFHVSSANDGASGGWPACAQPGSKIAGRRTFASARHEATAGTPVRLDRSVACRRAERCRAKGALDRHWCDDPPRRRGEFACA